MLKSKFIQIDFANNNKAAIDAIQDIRKGSDFAGLNLFSRHGVQLQYPMPRNGKVVVEVKIPSDIYDTFSVGYHLRGISAYMIRECNGKYADYLVGKRLLTYTELPSFPNESDDLSMIESMDLISRFAKLLQRNDAESMKTIREIANLLNGVKPSLDR